MGSMEELYTALRNADAAGDVEAARRLSAHIQSQQQAMAKPAAPEPSMMSEIKQGLGNLGAGALRGAGSIGATILAPIDMASDALAGKGLSLESNRARRAAMDSGLQYMGAEPESWLYKGGKLGAEVAGTLGVGGAVANGVRALSSAPAAQSLAQAIASGGFTTGREVAAGFMPKAADLALRTAGGSIMGGASAGLIDPSDAGAGALIGGLLPIGVKAAGAFGGKVGSGAKNLLSGPRASDDLQKQIMAARDAGYVIPPTQANPTFGNRMLEGFAGKLTTAQNASARNQPMTNKLAAAALGADDLTESSLGSVRQRAGDAYDKIKQVGQFIPDDAFQEALSKAGAASAKMKENFPKLVNTEIEGLVDSLTGRPQFDSDTTIEAIKQFRFDGAANKASMEPAKKALGAAQMKISNALEDLIDRNLQKVGAPELLTDYRAARTTFAKLYDVEKALNASTGNVDATKIGKLLQKGRPLTGELRTIGDFANSFPKAAQSIEKMGSLPQLSPLDWAVSGGIGMATANPMMLAGVFARPAARKLALSEMVQNKLLSPEALQRLQLKYPKKATPIEFPNEMALLEESPFKPRPQPQQPPSEYGGLLTLADEADIAARAPVPDSQRLATTHDYPTIDFPLRQEVLQQPEISGAIDSFRSEAQRLEQIAKNAISPAVRVKASKDLAYLQDEFAAGMRQLGISNSAGAHGLNRPLYETGGLTQLPIKKTWRN